MKFLSAFVVASLLIAAPGLCLELTVNGDFEEPLTTGWDQIIAASNYSVTRSTHYDPDPDYEARVSQGTGSGYVHVFQLFTIPSTDLAFSANLKLYAWDNASTGPWAGAALIIGYLDDFESCLGETFICTFSDNCPWTSSATTHLITASDSSWHPYSFNIDTELGNLPGVDPDDIRKVKVSLYTQVYHC
jgi:hypothetical protein